MRHFSRSGRRCTCKTGLRDSAGSCRRGWWSVCCRSRMPMVADIAQVQLCAGMRTASRYDSTNYDLSVFYVEQVYPYLNFSSLGIGQ